MPAIDYVGIRNQLKTILAGDARLGGVRIYVEEEPQIGISDAGSAIAVFTDERRLDPSGQSASAGHRTRYQLRMSFWTVYFSLESYLAACNGRDALLAQLELVLMDNRTIGGLVTASYLEGGVMFSARNAQGDTFCAAAETICASEVSAISP